MVGRVPIEGWIACVPRMDALCACPRHLLDRIGSLFMAAGVPQIFAVFIYFDRGLIAGDSVA